MGTTPEPGTLSALLEQLARAPAPGDVAGAPPGPGEKVGRFEVVRELGRGGLGVVLEARDPLLQRDVALKVVRPGRRVDAGGPALAEAAAVGRLSHPNIVALHDAALGDAGPYLVFEKLEGEPLSARLERGPLPVAEAARVGLEVAKGLAHAHRNAVVHRDLKPSNVFLCADGAVKVLDFGLALVFGSRRTIAGGTPGWMAPEQRRGAPEDERTDVWALGAVLFRSMTGRDPAGNRLHVEHGPALGALVGRMLEDDPVKRPRDAAEVVDALEPVVRALETQAAPATVRVRRGRARGARRAAVALAAVAASAALVWRFGPRGAAPPAARLVTPSLEAYRSYETGRSLESRSLPGAQQAYREAIDRAPGFALAHLALLSLAYRERAPLGDLRAIAAAAMRAADQAPWREERLIRGLDAIVARRATTEARALFREVLDRDPEDEEALLLHASIAASPEEALADLERALRVDPTYVPAQEQIVWALRDLGRPAELAPLARAWMAQPPAPRRLAAAALAFAAAGELDAALEAAKREDLLSPGRNALERVLLSRGEYVEAERTARARMARSGKDVGALALALGYQGRRREARAVLRDASRGLPAGSPGRAGFLGFAMAAGDGAGDGLRARARELVAAQPALGWLAAMGLALAGDPTEAERYASALSPERADPSSVVYPDEILLVRRLVEALAARARGDAAAGNAVLRDIVAARRYKARVVSAFALGRACLEDGDLGCAVAALRQHRAEQSPLVLFQDWMLPRSSLLLAEALERQGHADEARGLVERLLSDWRDADPDLPDLAPAHALCTRLRCRPALPARASDRPAAAPRAGAGAATPP